MHIKNLDQLKRTNLSDWAKQQAIDKYEKACNRNSGVPSDRKPDVKMAEVLPLEILESKRFNKAVRVSFHSIRQHMPDMDNLSGKAALDGIVKAGILPDDSAQWVPEQPRHTVEIGEEEKTIIIIEEV